MFPLSFGNGLFETGSRERREHESRFFLVKGNILRRDMEAGEKEALTRFLDVRTYEDGETIMDQNLSGNNLYILRSGSAEVVHEANGMRTRITSAREGALFGELSFLSGDLTSARVVAREGSVVYALTRDAFLKMMRQHQNLVYSLFAHMLEHTARIIRHMNGEHIGMMQYNYGA